MSNKIAKMSIKEAMSARQLRQWTHRLCAKVALWQDLEPDLASGNGEA
jgi:hypothetical protein